MMLSWSPLCSRKTSIVCQQALDRYKPSGCLLSAAMLSVYYFVAETWCTGWTDKVTVYRKTVQNNGLSQSFASFCVLVTRKDSFMHQDGERFSIISHLFSNWVVFIKVRKTCSCSRIVPEYLSVFFFFLIGWCFIPCHCEFRKIFDMQT